MTLHCLERDPEARFASVMDLSDMLYQAVHGNGENLEIQTLVDIHKAKSGDPALALHPEWLDSILSTAPEDSSPGKILLENAISSVQPPEAGLSSELPVQEIDSPGAPAAQAAPAESEPSSSLDVGQTVRRKTFHRSWSFAAVVGIIVLAVFIGLAVSQQRPGILIAAAQVSQAAPEPSPLSPNSSTTPTAVGTASTAAAAAAVATAAAAGTPVTAGTPATAGELPSPHRPRQPQLPPCSRSLHLWVAVRAR